MSLDVYKNTSTTPVMVSLLRKEAKSSIRSILQGEYHKDTDEKCLAPEPSQISVPVPVFRRCQRSNFCHQNGNVIFDEKKFDDLYLLLSELEDVGNEVQHSMTRTFCREHTSLAYNCGRTMPDVETSSKTYTTKQDGVLTSHTTGSAIIKVNFPTDIRLKIALKYPMMGAGRFELKTLEITLRDLNCPSKESIHVLREDLHKSEKYHVKETLKSSQVGFALKKLDKGLYYIEYSFRGAFSTENEFDIFGLCDLDPKLRMLYSLLKKHYVEYSAVRSTLLEIMKDEEIRNAFEYGLYVDLCNL